MLMELCVTSMERIEKHTFKYVIIIILYTYCLHILKAENLILLAESTYVHNIMHKNIASMLVHYWYLYVTIAKCIN